MLVNGNGLNNGSLAWSDTNAFRGADFVSQNDGAFMLSHIVSAVSSEYSHVQIYNPASSGVTCLVDGFLFQMNGNNTWRGGMHDTELATDVGAGVNVRNAGAAGACHLRAVTQVSAIAVSMFYAGVPTYQSIQWRFKNPLVLVSGEGFLLRADQTNQNIRVSYFWREV